MNAGRFANVSVHQRPVHQRVKMIRQHLLSVRQCLHVSSPTSLIHFEKGLKYIYHLPWEENVIFDVKRIVCFGLKCLFHSPQALPSHALLVLIRWLIDCRSYFIMLPNLKHPRVLSLEYEPLVKSFY